MMELLVIIIGVGLVALGKFLYEKGEKEQSKLLMILAFILVLAGLAILVIKLLWRFIQ